MASVWAPDSAAETLYWVEGSIFDLISPLHRCLFSLSSLFSLSPLSLSLSLSLALSLCLSLAISSSTLYLSPSRSLSFSLSLSLNLVLTLYHSLIASLRSHPDAALLIIFLFYFHASRRSHPNAALPIISFLSLFVCTFCGSVGRTPPLHLGVSFWEGVGRTPSIIKKVVLRRMQFKIDSKWAKMWITEGAAAKHMPKKG